jgi:hypothetical protein
MIGKIARVGPQKRFCFIEADGKDWYAHERDFPDKSIIRKNQMVEFRPKLAGEPGKPHPVTDVIAA